MTAGPDRVWYVAYGSNLCAERFWCYLRGGRPAGGAVRYPGCRDHSAPAETVALHVRGALYFTGESRTWGGGTAVFDPDGVSDVAARAYLLRTGQLADVLAQEMRRLPGAELDLGPLRSHGRHRAGPGRYETLVRVGTRDSLPMVTLTSGRHDDAVVTPPHESYLRTMASGLRDAHGWRSERIVAYLSALPGPDRRTVRRAVAADSSWHAARVPALHG